jgi:hypothetical protein
MAEKTITDVMREPIVSYRVDGYFDDPDSEEVQPFDTEAEAVDCARMMDSGGAADVGVERITLHVVEDREEIDWRA